MRGLIATLALFSAAPPAAAQAPAGRLVVFNAGSLAAPFRDLLRAFTRLHPAIEWVQESAGSLESVRKLTELGRIPDVLGVADYNLIPSLLIPRFAGWHLGFARNAMVLAYSERSIGADRISAANWWRVIREPRVRVGRSDPSLDPNGYRTLLVYQLAERYYEEPGLADRLLAASPRRYVRPKEADLVGLLQAGELDYAWSYRSLAETTGLRYLSLPREIDLSDPARAGWYAGASVRVPGPGGAGADSLTIRAEPILYGLTIPREAANPTAARAFVRFVLSREGQTILERNGFALLEAPLIAGPEPPPETIFPSPRSAGAHP